MADSDELFETAVDFLTGDTGLPSDIQGDFLAACLKHLYSGQTTIKEETKDHSHRIIRLETILTIGGVSGLGGGIIAIGKVFNWW